MIKKTLFGAFFVIFLSACGLNKTINPETALNRIQFEHLAKQPSIVVITENEPSFKKIKSVLESRELILLKKLPKFEYKIVVFEGGSISDEWMYNPKGFLMDVKNVSTYKVSFSEFNSILQID